jgi:dihydrodipicolinate synthase/N-acetylneuraminate lyase
MLRGALAAAVTPLRRGGRSVDLDAVAPLVEFLARGGVDGVLALGTTGEGLLLSRRERMRAAEAFVRAAAGRVPVAVHAGAQTTSETVALARHAAEIGASAVAVIAPPFYPLDAHALLEHFTAAAHACDPVPFYVYEFAARSGYAVPVEVVRRLRDVAPNLRGLKVSDATWNEVGPYLLDGLDAFIGNEPLVERGLAGGAAGAISGLATAFPAVVRELVHERTTRARSAVEALREAVAGVPFPAAMKAALAAGGVPVREDVRPPLRPLTSAERARWLADVRATAERLASETPPGEP